MIRRTTLAQELYNPAPEDLADIGESDGAHMPAYLDADSRPRDKFYRHVVRPVAGEMEYQLSIFTREQTPLMCQLPSELAPFPKPADFDRNSEFTGACQDWYCAMQRWLSTVLLPTPITGHFYSPEPPKIFRPEERNDPARFRTFKAVLWPLLPANYMEMLDILWSAREIDLEGEFPQQVPKREVIKYKHHVTCERQWQSQMVCHEPVAEIYDSFEEYERSYVNWRTVAIGEMREQMIRPKQFSRLIGLDFADVVEEEGSRATIEETSGELGAWMWLEGVEPVLSWPTIGEMCMKLQKKNRAKVPEEKMNVFDVLGLRTNAKSFVMEMREFGDDVGRTKTVVNGVTTLITPKLARQTGFLTVIQDPVDVRQLVEMVKSARKYDFQLLVELLKWDLTTAQWDTILTTEKGRLKMVALIGPMLTLSTLVQLFKYARFTDRHKYRISHFLRALFRDDPNSGLIKVLSTPANIQMFRGLVTLMMMTANPRLIVLPLAEGERRVYMTINRFYLLDLALRCFSDVTDSHLFRDCLEIMRSLMHDICMQLKDNHTVEEIRKSNQTALLMLLHCGSQQVHRLLLGDSYLSWLNTASMTRTGLVAIQTIVHGSAIHSACFLFLRCGCEMLKTMMKDLTSAMSAFVTAICNYLLVSGGKLHIQFRGQHLLAALEAASACKTEHIASMMIAMARLVVKPTMIINYDDRSYFPLMMATVIKLCREVSDEMLMYRYQIRALYILAESENCCLAMTQQRTFIEIIASHLNDPDVSLCDLTWYLVFRLARTDAVMKEVVSDGKIAGAFVAIANNKRINSHALHQLLVFSVTVWNRPDPELRKAYCWLLLPAIGGLVCLYKTRHVIFRNDRANKTAIRKFVHVVESFKKGDDTKEFVEKWNQHMESASSRNRSGTLWQKIQQFL